MLSSFFPPPSDYPSEIETNKFLNQAEKTTQNKSKNSQRFIKKNVEVSFKRIINNISLDVNEKVVYKQFW